MKDPMLPPLSLFLAAQSSFFSYVHFVVVFTNKHYSVIQRYVHSYPSIVRGCQNERSGTRKASRQTDLPEGVRMARQGAAEGLVCPSSPDSSPKSCSLVHVGWGGHVALPFNGYRNDSFSPRFPASVEWQMRYMFWGVVRRTSKLERR